jgi:hypothetical protein
LASATTLAAAAEEASRIAGELPTPKKPSSRQQQLHERSWTAISSRRATLWREREKKKDAEKEENEKSLIDNRR